MRFWLFVAAALLSCATPVHASEPAPPTPYPASDIVPDEGFVFGRLPNGLRYVVRHNERPENTALVRMQIETGSLDEREDERGYAHYVEHMAFNGSTNVPEGEMVRLLEREGLAFGADANASTGFEQTQYKLDLPRADPKLLDTALMLMRETAGKLSFDPEAVARERGVVMSELREGEGYRREEWRDSAEFFYPDMRYRQRLPIGVDDSLAKASGESLRGFYAREYTPQDTWLVIVGDFEVRQVVEAIERHFSDWTGPSPGPRPDAGTLAFDRGGETDVFLDPALPETLTVARNAPWVDRPDSIAIRREDLLRSIGYAVVNRRLARLARREEPPFKSAGFGTGDVFETGRTTRLVINTLESGWRAGLDAAVEEYGRAMRFGFTDAEVAEQVARIRTAAKNAAEGAATRTNGRLVSEAFGAIDDRRTPADPVAMLSEFEAFAPAITPAAVFEAMQRDAAPLDDPLIRFTGRTAPAGGAEALRAAWNAAAAREVAPFAEVHATAFAYTDFGPAGEVVSDVVEPVLGIREIVFANNVRLNLKRTKLQRNHVDVSLQLDGGTLLATRDDPEAVTLVRQLPAGGLAAHSNDELQTILAGRSVQRSFGSGTDYFGTFVHTIPRDLELQLQLLAATVADPGYRREGETAYRRIIDDYFAQLTSTPGGALAAAQGNILSDGDPRFSLSSPELYKGLTFARLRETIGDRLARGAIELAIVGDIDEEEAVAAVARTFGALPEREADFRVDEEARRRPFVAERSRHVVRHAGEPDQALVRFVWPTRDDSDPVEAIALELLERVMGIELLDGLRERLGKTYSPSANSSLSRDYRGYGTFSVTASVDLADVEETEQVIVAIARELQARPVDDDVLARARAPMLESYGNALKTNPGWIALADRAQTQPDRIDRFAKGKERAQAVTAEGVRALADRYLAPEAAVRFVVVPEAGKSD